MTESKKNVVEQHSSLFGNSEVTQKIKCCENGPIENFDNFIQLPKVKN
jgi:hypothetical protein